MRSIMKINEMFYSIQGESSFVGYPTFFVRTTGCNLRCTYCDTQYAYYEGSDLEIDAIVDSAVKSGAKHVCLTGGEPLLQKDIYQLMKALLQKQFVVSLETSGSKSIAEVPEDIKIILDVKTPDSGAADSFWAENLKFIRPSTEFKFVVCSERDLEWSENFCRQHQIFGKNMVLYSPSYGKMDARWLAEKILQQKSEARLQLQLHKYIWCSETRGV